MQVVMRNNAMLKPERKSLKEISNRYAKSRSIKAEYKESSEHMIRFFRDKTIAEQRSRDHKIGLTFVIMFSVFLSTFIYVLTQ